MHSNDELFLVTSKLTDDDNYINKIFLGTWCFDINENFANRAKIIDYHLKLNENFEVSHDYLQVVYEKVLKALTSYLNLLHKKNFDNEYWRIVIGPWLTIYIPVIWDRWNIVTEAFKFNNKYIIKKVSNNRPALFLNYDEFVSEVINDKLNTILFNKIIEFEYNDRVDWVDDITLLETKKPNTKNSTLSSLVKVYNKLISLIFGSPKILFITHYFNKLFYIKLSLSLRQIPRYFDYTFDAHKNNQKLKDRNIHSEIDMIQENRFETFLSKNILLDLPASYIETYDYIRSSINMLKLYPKAIFTANSYWNNDSFKIWLAEQRKTSKILISEHGGGLQLSINGFSHENTIANQYVIWTTVGKNNEKQLTPNKTNKYNKSYTQNGDCVIVGLEVPKYCYFFHSFPTSSNFVTFFKNTDLLIQHLLNDKEVQVKYKPYPNLGWNTSKYISTKYNEELIINDSFNEILKKSKLIVCTYPQTTFTEAMTYGIPTILVISKNDFIFRKDTEELIEHLLKAKILFYDVELASKHICEIWNDIDSWWLSKPVIAARDSYLFNYLKHSENPLREWSTYFKEILND